MEGRRNGEGACHLGNCPTFYTGTWKNGLRNGKVREDYGNMGTGMGRCMGLWGYGNRNGKVHGLVGIWEQEWEGAWACGDMETGMGRCVEMLGIWEQEWDVRMYNHAVSLEVLLVGLTQVPM